MQINVQNRESCLGCGFCVSCCRDVFQLAEDGLASVCGEMDEDNEEMVLAVIESCPVKLFYIDESLSE